MDYATKLQLLLTVLLFILLYIRIKVIERLRKNLLHKTRSGRAFLTNHPRKILTYPKHESDTVTVLLRRTSTYLSNKTIVMDSIQESCEKLIQKNTLVFPTESYEVKMFCHELGSEICINMQVNLN